MGSSVTYNSTGHYTVTFDVARPTDTYIIICQLIEDAGRDDMKVHVRQGLQTTTSFDVYIYEGDNGTTADTLRNNGFYFTVYD